MVTTNTFFRDFFIFSLMIYSGIAHTANITAHVDRNPVVVDESFTLILEARGSVDGNPDFSTLEKNFDILNTSQNNSTTYKNGQLTRRALWKLILIAKNKGVFTIPSIAFGNDQSPALRITVNDNVAANGSTEKTQPPIFLEVEVDKKSSWVHAQIIYIVRLVRTVGINSASLNEPETSDPDAIIEKLGEDAHYEAMRNGVRHVIIERRYAVYPQHSGPLTFKPMLFEGQISHRSSRSMFDQFMNAGKTKRLRSKKLSVDIKPKPGGIPNHQWLPANKISLSEKWSEPVAKLKVGEPVTRTINITVDGLMATQIPKIKLPEIDGLKQYPDQPVVNDAKKPEGIIGTRQIKIALIPSRNGEFKLPEIRIPWWNTRTGKKEMARLPAITLKVSGEKNAANSSAIMTPLAKIPLNLNTVIGNKSASPQIIQSRYWPWIALALLIGWACTLVLLIRKKHPAPSPHTSGKAPSATNLKPMEKRVLACIDQNDAEKTKNALLDWAKARWPEHNMTSLADIAQQSPAELSRAIGDLSATLYSSKRENWEGGALSSAFELVKNQTSGDSRSEQSVLEPLYKV